MLAAGPHHDNGDARLLGFCYLRAEQPGVLREQRYRGRVLRNRGADPLPPLFRPALVWIDHEPRPDGRCGPAHAPLHGRDERHFARDRDLKDRLAAEVGGSVECRTGRNEPRDRAKALNRPCGRRHLSRGGARAAARLRPVSASCKHTRGHAEDDEEAHAQPTGGADQQTSRFKTEQPLYETKSALERPSRPLGISARSSLCSPGPALDDHDMPLLINEPAMIAEVVLLLDDYHVIARERYLRGCNEHRRGYASRSTRSRRTRPPSGAS
jgi:hypothetical protein